LALNGHAAMSDLSPEWDAKQTSARQGCAILNEGLLRYTKADVKELRAHSKARTPIAKIMKLTKRTEGSLRQKALKLGISLGHRR
jgi:hypothetical protein